MLVENPPQNPSRLRVFLSLSPLNQQPARHGPIGERGPGDQHSPTNTTEKESSIMTAAATSGTTTSTFDGVRRDKIIYWTTTSIVGAIMLWSAYNFALTEAMKGAFAHLGLPNWFRVELTVAKFVGALALLIPAVPPRVKEFAYFGFGLTLVSAGVAHLSSGDSVAFELGHSAVLATLIASYVYYHKSQKQNGRS
jgi:DoxX-like family